jgi:hypothetical protein
LRSHANHGSKFIALRPDNAMTGADELCSDTAHGFSRPKNKSEERAITQAKVTTARSSKKCSEANRAGVLPWHPGLWLRPKADRSSWP